MGQKSNDATVKDAQIIFGVEECAIGMGQRADSAAALDAQIKFGKEEYALGMGQRGSTENVLLMGAQPMRRKEECA